MACSRMPKCMLRPAQFSGSKFPAPSMFVWVLGARSAEPPIISGRREPRTAIVFPEAMRVAIGPSAAVNVGRSASQPLGSCRCMTRWNSAARSGYSSA